MGDNKPYVWQMVKEAVDNLNSRASYTDIKEYIKIKWGNVNTLTITDQIQVLTVNHNSRINYPQNNKPRLTNTNSLYDCLFTTGRGQVVKYNPNEHGVWGIYKDKNDKLGVRQFSESIIAKIYTPTDIVWFKNVTNATTNEAYLDITENPFVIHFPNKHKTNVLKPAVDELILIYQKVNCIPAFTHIVTPVDNQLIENNQRADFRYGRLVKVIAKTNSQNIIKVSTTLWNRLKFGGINAR